MSNTLKLLHKYGFQTFNTIIDETYDEVVDDNHVPSYVQPAGSTKSTTYSICYTELLAFIAAYNEQRFTSIESRLATLESS